jgi:hypothetical protein
VDCLSAHNDSPPFGAGVKGAPDLSGIGQIIILNIHFEMRSEYCGNNLAGRGVKKWPPNRSTMQPLDPARVAGLVKLYQRPISNMLASH